MGCSVNQERRDILKLRSKFETQERNEHWELDLLTIQFSSIFRRQKFPAFYPWKYSRNKMAILPFKRIKGSVLSLTLSNEAIENIRNEL